MKAEDIRATLIVQHECEDRRFVGGDDTCVAVVMHLAITEDYPLPLCGKRARTRPYITHPTHDIDSVEIPRTCVRNSGGNIIWESRNGDVPIIDGHHLCAQCAIKLFLARGGQPLSFKEYLETPAAAPWLNNRKHG